MASYTFYCPECDVEMVLHFNMGTAPARTACPTCELPAFRQWRMPAVNWGGLAPSQGDLNVAARQLIAEAPQGQYEFLGEHEEHERRTANDNSDGIPGPA